MTTTTIDIIKSFSAKSKHFDEAVNRLIKDLSQSFTGRFAKICSVDARRDAAVWRNRGVHYRSNSGGEFLAMSCDVIAEVWETSSAVSLGQAEVLDDFFYVMRAEYNRRYKGEWAA